MTAVNPLRRALARLARRADQPAAIPTPMAVELAEMIDPEDLDPATLLALERRREEKVVAERRPRETVMARYGYLLFISTTR